MKTKHLFLLGLVTVFSSCGPSYRMGQTPDDVYYSPAPAQESYVTLGDQQDADSYANRNEQQQTTNDIQDPGYNNNLNFDLGFGYNPYTYGPYGFNSYNYSPFMFDPYSYAGIYNPYAYNYYGYNYSGYNYFGYSSMSFYGNYYGNHYGGYYQPVYLYPGIGTINTSPVGPRKVNLEAYNNNSNIPVNQGSVPVRTFNNLPRQRIGIIRRIFSPSNNGYYSPTSSNGRVENNDNNTNTRNNSDYSPARSFNNSSSGSSNSAPVRTFRR